MFSYFFVQVLSFGRKVAPVCWHMYAPCCMQHYPPGLCLKSCDFDATSGKRILNVTDFFNLYKQTVVVAFQLGCP